MTDKIKTGIELSLQTQVGKTDIARYYGSGLLDVYATPAMVAFMEKTSMELVQEYLPEGYGTVGIKIDVDHLKASAPGAILLCRSTLIEISDRKLRFEVEVTEEGVKVGSGSHERYIINEKRFIEKLGQ